MSLKSITYTLNMSFNTWIVLCEWRPVWLEVYTDNELSDQRIMQLTPHFEVN